MMIPEEVGDRYIRAREIFTSRHAKKMVLFAAGFAAQKYMQKIEKEQEVLVNIADMVSEVYNMESAILRTEKAINKTGEDKNKQKILYTQIYAQEAFNRMEAHAKETFISFEEGIP